MRKFTALFAAIVLLLSPQTVNAVSARSAIVIDGTTGQVLFSQNAEERLPMASTTKIMTAITAIENFDLDREYTVKKEYTLVEGSSMYLKEGEHITLRETLYGLMLMSGNDAALAIAGECGGKEQFVQSMNDTASRLGLENTHFDNPNGLDGDTHYTTAHELAIITAYAMKNPDFCEIVATKNHNTSSRYMKNHNRLLSLYDDAVGVKTGFTKKSGRCLVSAAERNGRRLIAVTLNAPDDWNDHISMLEAGFAQYTPYALHEQGEVLRKQPVQGGSVAAVEIAADHELSVWLTEQEQAKIEPILYGNRFTYAPIAAGGIWGKVQYQVDGIPLAEDNLHFVQGAALLPEQKSKLTKWIDNIRDQFPLGD